MSCIAIIDCRASSSLSCLYGGGNRAQSKHLKEMREVEVAGSRWRAEHRLISSDTVGKLFGFVKYRAMVHAQACHVARRHACTAFMRVLLYIVDRKLVKSLRRRRNCIINHGILLLCSKACSE